LPLLSWVTHSTVSWGTGIGVTPGFGVPCPAVAAALVVPGSDDAVVPSPPGRWEEVSVPTTTATTSAALRRA
jgi:hypothetical protein